VISIVGPDLAVNSGISGMNNKWHMNNYQAFFSDFWQVQVSIPTMTKKKGLPEQFLKKIHKENLYFFCIKVFIFIPKDI